MGALNTVVVIELASPLPLAGGAGGGPVPYRIGTLGERGACPPLAPPPGGRGISGLTLKITAIWLVGLAIVAPIAPARAAPSAGSIYDAATGYAPLYEGTRSRRVGDPVTILLAESINAAKTVGSKQGKSGGASITPPSQGLLSFLNPNALKASSDSSFNGSGSAAQTSTLNATLSVTIAEVRPNGTALIRGEKQMLLSQGNEWIRLSGVVRLSDIDQDNAVPSSRVADAKIEYSGKGALQRASKQGWLGKIFNIVSPF